jgi:hypothetical protein
VTSLFFVRLSVAEVGGEPAGDVGGMLGSDSFGEVDVVTEKVGTEVGGEGVEVDNRYTGGGHDAVSSSVVGLAVGRVAVKSGAPLIVDVFVAWGGGYPDQLLV